MNRSIGDRVGGDGFCAFNDEVLRRLSSKRHKTSGDILDDRERKIIRWYYGLGGLQPMKLGQIGKRLGFTKERIRQVRERALQKLRRQRGDLLAEFVYS